MACVSLGRSILSRSIGPFNEISKTGNVMICTRHDPGVRQLNQYAELLFPVFTQSHLHGTRRGTCCSGMEVSESHTFAGNLVNVRSTDLASKAGEITEPQIISNDNQEVWAFLGAASCVRSLRCGGHACSQKSKLSKYSSFEVQGQWLGKTGRRKGEQQSEIA